MLLIFIDGLSYDEAKKNLDVLRNAKVNEIQPGIGFSNNLYPEMLAGKNPDEMGYFNEWSPIKGETKKLNFWIRALDIFREFLYINAGIRKILLKKIFGLNFSNIPFKYAHFFEPHGSHDFRIQKEGILVDYKFQIFDAVEQEGKVGTRDKKAIEQAIKGSSKQNTLVSLMDIDNLCHIHGLHSTHVKRHINFLNKAIGKLIKTYSSIDPNVEIILFSDHGMSEVNRIESLDLEQKFGPMKKSKYLYFLDSTFLRVWSTDEKFKEAVLRYLMELDFGYVLSDKERSEFGLTNPEFGDIIFRAAEKTIFLPNFYGSRPVKAMHGYDSKLKSQKAFISQVQGTRKSSILPVKSKDVQKFLLDLLKV